MSDPYEGIGDYLRLALIPLAFVAFVLAIALWVIRHL